MKLIYRFALTFALVLSFAFGNVANAQRGKVVYHPQQSSSGIHSNAEVHYNVGPGQLYFFIVGSTGVNTTPSSQIECGASATVGGPDAAGNCWETVDSSGNFGFGGDYECPNDTADTSLVYLVVKNAAVNGGTQNPYFTQVLALPYTCGYLQANGASISNLIISDFTTVAAAVEAAPFLNTTASLGDGFGVALSNTASYNALSAAFATANSFLSNAGYYDDSNQTIETQLNTYGDILAICNIQNGGGGANGICAQTNSTAPQWASTTVNDPWQALVGVVQSPSSSTTTNVIYLTPPTPPYNPNYGNVPAGGLRLSLPGAPFITCPSNPSQHKTTGVSFAVTGITTGSTLTAVAYGQAKPATYNATTGMFSFTVPNTLGKGALVLYQNGVASNACEFQIIP